MNKNLWWPKRLRHKQDPHGTIKDLSAQLNKNLTAQAQALENKQASRHKQIPHDANKYLTAQFLFVTHINLSRLFQCCEEPPNNFLQFTITSTQQ